MKKFKFKLQKLLEIRERNEEEVKNELAALLAIQNSEKNRQEELRNSIERQRLLFQDKMRKGDFTVSEEIAFEKYVDISYRAIDVFDKKIDAMEPEIMKIREKLIEASRERMVVDKLKERKLNQYNYEMNREIVNENDDLNQKIYLRNLMASE